MKPVMRSKSVERFWRKVSPEPNTGCWLWTGGLRRGYGAFEIDYRKYQATHVALMLSGVTIPPGSDVCHKCDTPLCVNPSHLFVGTRSDNMRDCSAKGRFFLQREPSMAAGEKNGRARLTRVQVDDIRARYSAGGVTRKTLADEHGVGHSTIDGIVDGVRWK